MTSAVIDLKLDAEERLLAVDGGQLGMLRVRAPSAALELDCRERLRTPLRANARAVADAVIGACLEPPRTPQEVAHWPEAVRARLRRAVAEKCAMETTSRALYGTYLSGDERLIAIMIWHWDDVIERAMERLRAKRCRFGGDGLNSARIMPTAANGTSAGAGPRVMGHGLASRFDDQIKRTNRLLRQAGIGAQPDRVEARFSPVRQAHLVAAAATRQPIVSAYGLAASGVDRTLEMARGVGPFDRVVQPITLGPNSPLGRVLGLGRRAQNTLNRVFPFVGPAFPAVRIDGALQRAFGVQGSPAIPGGFDLVRIRRTSDLTGGILSVPEPAPAQRAMNGLVRRGFPVIGTPKFGVVQSNRILEMLRNGRDWFRPGSFGAQLLEKTRDFVAQVDLVDAFLKRLDRDGWHFVLHQLDLRSLVRLARLEHDAAVVQALLLDTLDLVLREDEEFVAALKQLVDEVPYLTGPQRRHIKTGLDWMHQGEPIDADPPLTRGIEGAWWRVGEGLGVITPERTHADQPTRRIGFETMVKKIVVSGELRTFIVRRAYGDAGNPFRHGDNDDGDREHALVLVIVLAGLLDLISEYRVSDLLGDLASHYLLQAIEQRSDVLGAG